MQRRTFLAGIAALAATRSAGAQQERVPRVGVVMTGSPPRDTFDAFLAGLRELGYVDGRNIRLEVRWDQFDSTRHAQIAEEFAALPLSVIFGGSYAFTVEASRRIKKTPIVAILIAPLEGHVVGGYAKPGSNLTGLAMISAELFQKRLQLLREALPSVRRIVILTTTGEVGALYLRVSKSAANRLGMEVIARVIGSPDELEPSIASATREGAEALATTQGPLFRSQRKRIAAIALQRRLPTITGETGFAAAGGLMNFGPDIPATYKRAAFYIDKVLKGVKPAELPIEQPTQFEFALNLTTAKTLGINLPQSLLARADQIIQ